MKEKRKSDKNVKGAFGNGNKSIPKDYHKTHFLKPKEMRAFTKKDK